MGLVDNLPAMHLMRSEEMICVQLIVPVESSHRAISYLGQLGLFQFRDLNADKSPFQRTFVTQVKRCGEMLRMLCFLKDQIDKAGLPLLGRPSLEPNMDLEALEKQLGDFEHELVEMNSNHEKLEQSYNEMLEFKMVLQKAGGFLSSNKRKTSAIEETELDELTHHRNGFVETSSLLEQEIRPGPSSQSGLRFVSGIICKSKLISFERMLFRATRGNMLFNQATADKPVIDPLSNEMVEKVVFVAFFSGEQARIKVLKICEAFGANCYPLPEDATKRSQTTKEALSRLSELEATLEAGVRHRNNILSSIGADLGRWMDMVRREKGVYDSLNKLNFDVTKKCLVGEGWCPKFAKPQMQDVLQRATHDSHSQVGIIFHVMDAVESPPTYFRMSRFTTAFQDMIDAYGVARYREANPAVLSIVTFPFFFAVMFGDWGHGICLLLAALVLIARESKLGSQKLGSFTEMLFAGRYMLLLMSLFSIYCGLIYNEFFSVPFHTFGPSSYGCRDETCGDARTAGLVKYRDAYPFGVDPSWRGSRSELPFLNSLKMKMSILLGVVHMNAGILHSYFNARFFRSDIDVRHQFLPHLVFLNSLFGYLSLLIVVKWCTGSEADLYHVMIYMFLSPAQPLGDNELFRGQRPFQILLLLSAAVAVPWMLFPKPIILRRRHLERFQGRGYGVLRSVEDAEPDPARRHDDYGDDGEFNFTEVFVHQMIHSIEFVLGSVSNTASYLRLWALSLAHSELSAVFYERVLLLAWGYDSILVRAVGVGVFAFATVFVLLMMETLSALLHSLRLHWIEFMNKFYQGDGYKFRPFSFASLAPGH